MPRNETLPSHAEREALEKIADAMEAVARQTIASATYSYDSAMHEVNVRAKLFSYAWELKQMARAGTGV